MSPPVLRPTHARFLKRLHQLGPGVSPGPRYQCLNFSSDSQWLVSVDQGQQLRWWKLSERDVCPMVSVPLRSASAAVALPGAGRVISGTYGGTMQEWSASDGSLQRENHFNGISGLFLAPDARTLLVTSSGSCCLWDTEQWRLVREFEKSPLQLYPGTLSPDGRLALAGMGNLYSDPRVALCVWDVATGAIVREVAMPGSCVASVAFHPSEPLLVAGTLTSDIYVVDTSRWQVVRQMESLGTCNMSFSPSGELVVAGETGFSVLDSHSGASLYEYQGKSDERGSDAVFSQDGRFIAWGQDDGTVGLWGVED